MTERCLNVDWIRCARKVMYRSRKIARDAAVRLGRKHAKVYEPYACVVCGGFHLATDKGGK